MASDSQFTELLLRPAPIMEVLDHPKAQAITQNPDMLKLIWTTVVPDIKDLPVYLETGKSPKYDPEKILGRWNFNVNVTMSLLRRAKPNISSKEMQGWKKWMMASFAKTSFVAMTDHQAILKNLPATEAHGGGRRALRAGRKRSRASGQKLWTANTSLPSRAQAKDAVIDGQD